MCKKNVFLGEHPLKNEEMEELLVQNAAIFHSIDTLHVMELDINIDTSATKTSSETE